MQLTVSLKLPEESSGGSVSTAPEDSTQGSVKQEADQDISSGSQEPHACVQTQDGGTWAQMAEQAALPGGPWRMGGLGFGLPLSRLYARYFGANASPADVNGSVCICSFLLLYTGL